MNIFLDMDGVIVDFFESACLAHGKDPETELNNWTPGDWDMAVKWGMSNKEFYSKLTEKWWAELKPSKEFNLVMASLKEYVENGNLCILTSHSNRSEIAAGKVKWLKEYLTDIPYILTKSKYFCASSNSVLIDDHDLNCAKFEKYGGKSILFPRIWNQNHEHHKDPVGYMNDKLAEFSFNKKLESIY